MLRHTLLLLLLCLQLFSFSLQESYFLQSHKVKLQDLLPHAPYDVILYKIDPNRYSKKISSKRVLALLKKYGFEDVQSSSKYIVFAKKSPIDTSKIQKQLLDIYKDKYPGIQVHSLSLWPKSFMKSLPLEYEVRLQKKSHLSNKGVLSIKTLDKKRFFFDYTLNADIPIYSARKVIHKGEKLSSLNTTRKMLQLDRLKALPLTKEQLNFTQSKRKLKADTIITLRDIDSLNLIRRGDRVSVHLHNENINISFSAKALQNGKLHDIITIQKANKQRMHAKVIAKNRVEIK